MREIKFRALYRHRQTGKLIWIVYGTQVNYRSTINYDEIIVEDLQYTGLQDKNGKEIYEGDTVKTVALLNDHFQKGATSTVIVRQFMGNFCLCFEGYETGTPIYPFIVSHEIEVIGSTYESPHLLEQPI